MPVQVVACISINPDEPDALKTYFDTTTSLLEEVGARVLQKMDTEAVVVGKPIAETLMVVEYPDLQALDRVFKSPEYKAIIPARDKAFLTYNVSILTQSEATSA